MNIDFVEPQPEEKITEHIMSAGEVIGEMVTYKDRVLGSPYHAIFRCKGDPCTLLMQGHGDTKEDAIKNALSSGRRDADALLKAVAELEAKLFGEKSPHKPPRHPKDSPVG